MSRTARMPRHLPVLLLIGVLALPGCARDGAEAGTAEPAPAAEARQAPTPDHEQLQRETLSTMRMVGVAMMAWLTDAAGAAAAGQTVTATDWPSADFADVEAALVPAYLQDLPRDDAWGNPFEYRLSVADPLASNAMLIRSAGSDGEFEGDRYPMGSFHPEAHESDLVWTDGMFVRWPERPDPPQQ